MVFNRRRIFSSSRQPRRTFGLVATAEIDHLVDLSLPNCYNNCSRMPSLRHDEFKAKCSELRRLATAQELSNSVSFALENSWTTTLKSDKQHFLDPYDADTLPLFAFSLTPVSPLLFLFLSESVAFRRVYGLESHSQTSGESNHHRQSVSDVKNAAIPTEPRGRLFHLSLFRLTFGHLSSRLSGWPSVL